MDNKVSFRIGSTPNYATVNIGSLSLHFSYETLIALDTPDARYISENIWGPTTGKHINRISTDKSERLPRDEFERITGDVLEDYGFRV